MLCAEATALWAKMDNYTVEELLLLRERLRRLLAWAQGLEYRPLPFLIKDGKK